MGSLIGHVLLGTSFLLVEVWHIWRSVVRYVSNPKSFQIRIWNPVLGFDGKIKYLELYLVAIGAFIDMCIELLYSTYLKFFVNGVLNPTYMNIFEHGGMLLMFFIFSVISLLSEKTRDLWMLCYGMGAPFHSREPGNYVDIKALGFLGLNLWGARLYQEFLLLLALFLMIGFLLIPISKREGCLL